MTRPRKSTAVLEASGAFNKNPKRAIGRGHDLETVGELGPPPKTLSLEEKREWKRIVSFYPPGTLKSGHFYAVLTIAQLGALIRCGKPSGSERAVLKTFLSEMGLTMKAAASVQIPKNSKDNPFSHV